MGVMVTSLRCQVVAPSAPFCLVADRSHNYPFICFHECKETLEKKAMMVIDAARKRT